MDLFLIFVAFILGFSFSKASVPTILKISKAKNIYDPIDQRKLHTSPIPSLGGIAIFLGFILSLVLTTSNIAIHHLKHIFAALILMFFIGLKDDLINVRAYKKLAIQFFAAGLLVCLGKFRISSFYGLLGIQEIGIWTETSVSIILILIIINAFNLIDGIDGLASGLAIFSASALGVWFYLSSNHAFAVISFALVGALFGFFIYNAFAVKDKLFMGDTGSLVTGTLIAILILQFLKLNASTANAFAIEAAPSVALALIIVPVIDTLRVITIRIIQCKSPFYPDKNHIHHRLLSLYPCHLKVTGILVATNIFMFALALWFNHLAFNINLQFIIILLIGIGLSFVPSFMLRRKSRHPKLSGKSASFTI